MRLISLTLAGYGRFERAKADLDGPVIALVGPNEAGKTTLLKAIESLEDDEAIRPQLFTRGLEPPRAARDRLVTARYLLDEQERRALADMTGLGQPRWLVVEKRRNGVRSYALDPDIVRDREPRQHLLERIGRSHRNTRLKKVLDAPPGDDEASLVTLREQMTDVETWLDDDSETLPEAAISAIAALEESLRARDHSAFMTLLAATHQAHETERSPEPREAALEFASQRRPSAHFFSDEHRRLNHEYPLTSVRNPPPALENLLRMAGVTGTQIVSSISTGEHHERLGIQKRANERLQQRFSTAWQQSDVFPQLHLDEAVLRIHVPSRNTLAPIAERSDGLRTFVALVAFTDGLSEGASPILLIDEAERHLHYDAQADLVRVFEQQEIVSQIIYTTHSAGCLPSDLGVGVRAVQPVPSEDLQDTARSVVTSSFWSDAPGFSPLLFAMGANVLAFAPSRAAVLTEGRSDPIVLPSLLREATGKERLGFQVAPGIANVSRREVQALDLEAPRVAYLLDGDPGGKENGGKLRRGGVPASSIVHLPGGRVLEDFVEPSLYLWAVNEELRRSHGHSAQLELSLPDRARPTAVKIACRKKGFPPPDKVRVAGRVLDRRAEGPLLDPRRKHDLNRIYRTLRAALNLGEDNGAA